MLMLKMLNHYSHYCLILLILLLAELLPGANWSGSSRPVTSEGCYSQEDWIVRTGEDGSGRLLTDDFRLQDTGSIKALPFSEARLT